MARSKSRRSGLPTGISRSSVEVSAPAATARMPITPTPRPAAVAMISRGRAGPSQRCIPPGESSRFVMHCATAGAAGPARTSRTASGNPAAVMPQARARPLATMRSNAGTTASRKVWRLTRVVAPSGASRSIMPWRMKASTWSMRIRARLASRLLERRSYTSPGGGLPSMHLVVTSTPAGKAPSKARPITRSPSLSRP